MGRQRGVRASVGEILIFIFLMQNPAFWCILGLKMGASKSYVNYKQMF